MDDRSELRPRPSAELLHSAPGSGDEGLTNRGERRTSTLTIFRIFLEVGATSFGGLGPSLAIIERELVEKRGVLTAAEVVEATAATRFLPGSSLIQVMSFLGYKLGGWTGSAVATLAGVLLPVTAMLLLAISYDVVSHWPTFGRAAQGLGATVVGLLLASACRFGRATIGSPMGWESPSPLSARRPVWACLPSRSSSPPA